MVGCDIDKEKKGVCVGVTFVLCTDMSSQKDKGRNQSVDQQVKYNATDSFLFVKSTKHAECLFKSACQKRSYSPSSTNSSEEALQNKDSFVLRRRLLNTNDQLATPPLPVVFSIF
jgi:hypothetical protein